MVSYSRFVIASFLGTPTGQFLLSLILLFLYVKINSIIFLVLGVGSGVLAVVLAAKLISGVAILCVLCVLVSGFWGSRAFSEPDVYTFKTLSAVVGDKSGGAYNTVLVWVDGRYLAAKVSISFREISPSYQIERVSQITIYDGRLEKYKGDQLIVRVENDDRFIIRETLWGEITTQLRNRISEISFQHLGENAALLEAMVFGLSDHLDSSESKVYRNLGLGHVLVASGANIIMIVQALEAIFERLRFKYKRIAELFIIFIYFLLVGFQGSMIRAFIFFCIGMVSRRVGREVTFIHKVLLTIVLSILIFPGEVLELSFQLSFLATLGLAFSGDIIELVRIKKNFIKSLIQNIVLIFVVNIFTSYAFKSFNVTGFFMNLALLFLVEFIVSYGFLFTIATFLLSFIKLSFLSAILAIPLNSLIIMFKSVVKLGDMLLSDHFNYSLYLNKYFVLFFFSSLVVAWSRICYHNAILQVR